MVEGVWQGGRDRVGGARRGCWIPKLLDRGDRDSVEEAQPRSLHEFELEALDQETSEDYENLKA